MCSAPPGLSDHIQSHNEAQFVPEATFVRQSAPASEISDLASKQSEDTGNDGVVYIEAPNSFLPGEKARGKRKATEPSPSSPSAELSTKRVRSISPQPDCDASHACHTSPHALIESLSLQLDVTIDGQETCASGLSNNGQEGRLEILNNLEEILLLERFSDFSNTQDDHIQKIMNDAHAEEDDGAQTRKDFYDQHGLLRGWYSLQPTFSELQQQWRKALAIRRATRGHVAPRSRPTRPEAPPVPVSMLTGSLLQPITRHAETADDEVSARFGAAELAVMQELGLSVEQYLDEDSSDSSSSSDDDDDDSQSNQSEELSSESSANSDSGDESLPDVQPLPLERIQLFGHVMLPVRTFFHTFPLTAAERMKVTEVLQKFSHYFAPIVNAGLEHENQRKSEMTRLQPTTEKALDSRSTLENASSITRTAYGWRVLGKRGSIFAVDSEAVFVYVPAEEGYYEQSFKIYHEDFNEIAVGLSILQKGIKSATNWDSNGLRQRTAEFDRRNAMQPAARWIKVGRDGLYSYITASGVSFSISEDGFMITENGEYVSLSLDEFCEAILDIADEQAIDACGVGILGEEHHVAVLPPEHEATVTLFDDFAAVETSHAYAFNTVYEMSVANLTSRIWNHHSSSDPIFVYTRALNERPEPDYDDEYAEATDDCVNLEPQKEVPRRKTYRHDDFSDCAAVKALCFSQTQPGSTGMTRRLTHAFMNFLATKPTRVPEGAIQAAPAWQPPATDGKQPRRPPFALIDAFIRRPELMKALAEFVDPESLVILYSISKPFHYFFNAHETTYILANARHNAPYAEEALPFTAYRSLCIRDPAGRRLNRDPRELRFVPGLKWLRMVYHRHTTGSAILWALRRGGHKTPPGALSVLQKLMFTMDQPNNAQRIALVHTARYWRDADLQTATALLVKLDLFFTDPWGGRGEMALRDTLLGQRSLELLRDVLCASEQPDLWDVVRLRVRLDNELGVGGAGGSALDSVLGVPAEDVGVGCLDGWGRLPPWIKGPMRIMRLAQRQRLLRVDELVMREAFRRELRMEDYWLDCAMYGYWVRATLERAAIKAEPVGDEDKKLELEGSKDGLDESKEAPGESMEGLEGSKEGLAELRVAE